MQKELLMKHNNFHLTTSIQTYNNNFIYCIIKFENYFLLSTSNGYIILYNINTYKIKQILKLSESSIKYMYLLKENYILFCTLNGELKIIEIKNGSHNDIQILNKNNRETIKKCIQFSNGKLICSCQEENIKFWKKENNGNAYLYDKEININPKFIYNIIEINDNEICSIEKEDTKYYINFYNINEKKIINSIPSFKELLLQTQSAIKYDDNLLIVGANNGLMFINYIDYINKGLIIFESKPWCIYKLLNNNLLIGDSFGNLFNIKIIDKDKLEIKILNKTNKVLNRMINNILEIKDKNNNKIIVGGNDEFFKIYEFFN
jgi:WD40 repeat protein